MHATSIEIITRTPTHVRTVSRQQVWCAGTRRMTTSARLRTNQKSKEEGGLGLPLHMETMEKGDRCGKARAKQAPWPPGEILWGGVGGDPVRAGAEGNIALITTQAGDSEETTPTDTLSTTHGGESEGPTATATFILPGLVPSFRT